jgi:hypothetical protein
LDYAVVGKAIGRFRRRLTLDASLCTQLAVIQQQFWTQRRPGEPVHVEGAVTEGDGGLDSPGPVLRRVRDLASIVSDEAVTKVHGQDGPSVQVRAGRQAQFRQDQGVQFLGFVGYQYGPKDGGLDVGEPLFTEGLGAVPDGSFQAQVKHEIC